MQRRTYQVGPLRLEIGGSTPKEPVSYKVGKDRRGRHVMTLDTVTALGWKHLSVRREICRDATEIASCLGQILPVITPGGIEVFVAYPVEP